MHLSNLYDFWCMHEMYSRNSDQILQSHDLSSNVSSMSQSEIALIIHDIKHIAFGDHLIAFCDRMDAFVDRINAFFCEKTESS